MYNDDGTNDVRKWPDQHYSSFQSKLIFAKIYSTEDGVMKKCFECGEKAYEEHHVIPVSRGGTKTISLCTLCHMKVHDIWSEKTRKDSAKVLEDSLLSNVTKLCDNLTPIELICLDINKHKNDIIDKCLGERARYYGED